LAPRSNKGFASAGFGETGRDGRSDAGSVMATVARRDLPGKMADLVCPPPVSARHHPAHHLALSAFLRSAIATSTICSLSMDSMCPTKRRDGSLEVRASGETIEVTGIANHVLFGDPDIDQALGKQFLKTDKVARADVLVPSKTLFQPSIAAPPSRRR
jgi:hypothetical protein